MRVSLILDDLTAQSLRRRAESRNQSMSRYLAEIAQAEAKRVDDALADEGYRVLAHDTLDFAENALLVAEQDWK